MKDLKKAENRLKKAMQVILTVQFVLNMVMVSFAEDYAKNGVTWLLDQAFWIVIFFMIVGLGVAYSKHATAAMISVAITGGIIAYACKNPESFTKIGETFARVVTGG